MGSGTLRACYCLVFIFLLSPGCASPSASDTVVYRALAGEVRLLDRATMNHLVLLDQSVVGRDHRGRMVVRTKWQNRAQTPYRARLRRVFRREDGEKEAGGQGWDVQIFEPGSRTVVEWKSYSSEASGYLIEVGSD